MLFGLARLRALLQSHLYHDGMAQASARHVLLTGLPGCGKTTVVRRVVEALGELRAAGFYTREVREGARRVGFEIVGLGGQRYLLARVDWPSRLRVGRYGVEPDRLGRIIEAELGQLAGEVDVYVIDEIGKMECLCPSFVEAVRRVLDGPVPVLATVALRGAGVIAEVKTRPDVRLIAVDPANRDDLPHQLASILRGQGGGEP
jgi:nucleoside-triphosphatase